jgi:protein gp37
MGRETGISWTDHTFNPWWGCTKVSPGCDNCYADAFDKRTGGAHWGKGAPRRTFGDKHWNEPLRWNREAEAKGVQAKVFCASMADVMDDEAPEGQRQRLWELVDETPYLIWQFLTKRPHRYLRYLPPAGFMHHNAILGTTAEDQERYNARIGHVRHAADTFDLKCFVSYEPALGALSFQGNSPDWLIFGGETGPNRRPMEQQWAEAIKAECDAFGVPFFMKQMSAATPARAAELIPPRLLIHNFPVAQKETA